jgi:hypothetical protein
MQAPGMYCKPHQNLNFLLLLLFLAGATISGIAQNITMPNVATVVNKKSIILGEQIELTIAYRYPATETPSSIPGINDTFPHFEVVERLKADTTLSADFRQVTQKFLITSFDSGHWTIPSFILAVGKNSYRSDTIGINVNTIKIEGSEYNDIKEIIEVEEPPFDWMLWGGILISIIVVVLGVWYYLKRRKQKPPVKENFDTSLSPLDQALQELAKLKKSSLQEKGEMKVFYTRAGEILKIFLERKVGKGFLQYTTDQTLIAVKSKFSDAVAFSSFAEVLRIADAVKFAKYGSSSTEAMKSIDVLMESVKDLNQQKN